jgi:pimeloyl-ACP methyl ester carboxylesterase
MYYEVHGSGDPVVLLHGSFMTISNNWTGWIGELSKTRKVIAFEMRGHGRTGDTRQVACRHAQSVGGVAAKRAVEILKPPMFDAEGVPRGGTRRRPLRFIPASE